MNSERESWKPALAVQFDDCLMSRVFTTGLGDQGSIIPKTQKMVLNAILLNIQYYKVRIKGKVEQYRERSSTLPYTLV